MKKDNFNFNICNNRSRKSMGKGDDPPTAFTNKDAIDLVQSHADYLWTLIAAALVFFMQAGFAMVEAGFTRAKKRYQYNDEESDGFFHGFPCLLGNRIRIYVRYIRIGLDWYIRLFPE